MKKILAVLLAAVVIFSCFALTAFAANASKSDAFSLTDAADDAEKTESKGIIMTVLSFFWDIIVKIREVFVQYLVYPFFSIIVKMM